MRQILLFLYFFIFFNSYSQVISFPQVKSKKLKEVEVVEIERTYGALIVTLKYENLSISKKEFLNIRKKTYLVDRFTSIEYKVTDIVDISFYPKSIKLLPNKAFVFKLIFENIPSEVTFVDLIEKKAFFKEKNIEIFGIKTWNSLKLKVDVVNSINNKPEINAEVRLINEGEVLASGVTNNLGQADFGNFEIDENENYFIEIVKEGFKPHLKILNFENLKSNTGYILTSVIEPIDVESFYNNCYSCWDEKTLKWYFSTHSTSSFEGVYEMYDGNRIKTQFGIKNINNKLLLVFLYSGDGDWRKYEEGEVFAFMKPTAVNNIFKLNEGVLLRSYEIGKPTFIEFYQNNFNLKFQDDKEFTFIKIYPINKERMDGNNKGALGSGTAFAISNDGYIATNCHVVYDRKENFFPTRFKIRGVNGDFSKELNCRLVKLDEQNDLAILKITDDFVYKTEIPYNLVRETQDVGTKVFTFGFPETNVLGEEMKMTDGIINAKSGYKGDVSLYQTNAIIHHGSSGGPLINENGECVGINRGATNKQDDISNVLYAVKMQYLFNLIDVVTEEIKLPNGNGKVFEQTHFYKDMNGFVFIMEVYN